LPIPEGYEFNPETKDLVLEGLRENVRRHGKPYCPCRLIRNDQSICHCLEFRTTGHCHCQLFKPKNGVAVFRRDDSLDV
jgi:ferredoxin-thioredoxin reductase catalytic subunit